MPTDVNELPNLDMPAIYKMIAERDIGIEQRDRLIDQYKQHIQIQQAQLENYANAAEAAAAEEAKLEEAVESMIEAEELTVEEPAPTPLKRKR